MYKKTIAATTLEDVRAGTGLVDCLCDYCRVQCRTSFLGSGSKSFFYINRAWTRSPLWFLNVKERKGVCLQGTPGKVDSSTCEWYDVCLKGGPKIQGVDCKDESCLPLPLPAS